MSRPGNFIQTNTSAQTSPHAATIYNGPKNNVVFNAGTILWAQWHSFPPGHLPPKPIGKNPESPDPRVQRMMENLLRRFTDKDQ